MTNYKDLPFLFFDTEIRNLYIFSVVSNIIIAVVIEKASLN
jgi:hypothetical protein